jgi:PilZ domain
VTANNRKAERYEIAIPIEIKLESGPFTATTKNLSLGGAFIASERVLAFGTRVTLRFKVPTQVEVIEVGGTIRWNAGGGFGVMFDGLRAHDVYALNKLFERPST